MTAINLPFAASATKRAPTADELANGYGCGDADRQLFDWLAWWETGQIGNAIAKSGLPVDDTDIERLTKAIRSQRLNYVATVGGTANALTATLDPAPTSMAELLATTFVVLPSSDNTGPMTFNIGFGAVALTSRRAAPLVALDVRAGQPFTMRFDGTRLRIVEPVPSEIVAGVNAARGIQVFTSNGTFNVPPEITKVRLRLFGGGGGGGGSTASNGGGAGGGGGGGGEGPVDVTPGASVPVIIGLGGAGGTGAPTNGSAGGTTSFGSIASAPGGAGGSGATPGFPNGAGVGGGGPASGVAIQFSGNGSSSGGSVGGTGVGGAGGASYYAGTNVAPIGSGNGITAIYPGQGGNGGGGVGFTGGAGANGIVIVEW